MKCNRKDCQDWIPTRIEDDCSDCVDGRYIEAVNEYASTCDGCSENTSHDLMWMDPVTQLGYCERCVRILNNQIEEKNFIKIECNYSKWYEIHVL